MFQQLVTKWSFITGITLLSFLPVTDQVRAKEPSRPSVAATVSLSGELNAPQVISINELKKFPTQSLKDLPIVCRSGEVKETVKSPKGVLLRDLLDRGQPKLPGHFDANHAYVVVSAADGYKVVFSWNELYNVYRRWGCSRLRTGRKTHYLKRRPVCPGVGK